jgi:hypothetical protein
VEVFEPEHGCIDLAVGGFAVLGIGLEDLLIGIEGGLIFAALGLTLRLSDLDGCLAVFLMVTLYPTHATDESDTETDEGAQVSDPGHEWLDAIRLCGRRGCLARLAMRADDGVGGDHLPAGDARFSCGWRFVCGFVAH